MLSVLFADFLKKEQVTAYYLKKNITLRIANFVLYFIYCSYKLKTYLQSGQSIFAQLFEDHN